MNTAHHAPSDATGSICFTVPGIPTPFARAGGGSSVRRFTPEKQRSVMGAIKLFGASAMRGATPLEGPVHLSVTAVWPWPSSWSDKKRLEPWRSWKTSRPDLDNIVKLVCDALNGVCWRDDAQICSGQQRKCYGQHPGIEIEIRRLT